MSSDQTWLSRKLSPIIEEYEVADVVLIGAVLLTAASIFTPLIHPLIGIGIAWGSYTALKAAGFYEGERSPLKNGMHTEIDEGDYTYACSDCGNEYKEKHGYKMLFIAGYEVFRVEEFHSNECEECIEEVEVEEDDTESDTAVSNMVKEYHRKRDRRRQKVK